MSSDCDRYLDMLRGQAQVTLTGATDAQLRAQFFDVLREFFSMSNAWQEDITIPVIPDALDYPIEPVSGRILRLLSVVDQNNVCQQAVLLLPVTVHFLYPYSQVQPMMATVVKTVTDPLECFPPDFPEWVLPIYGLGILDGVLAHMMLQPGQLWSNQASGIFHMQRFRNEMMRARVATRQLNTIGAQAWAFPQMYRTFSQRGGVSTYNVHPSAMTRR
jgi:hypothetical protein